MRIALAVFLLAAPAVAQQEEFLAKNGTDAQVAALQGPARTQRVREIQLAYEQLASKYHATFAYAKAAEVYEQFASHGYLDAGVRRDAARNAMVLYGAMEKRDKIAAMQRLYFQLAPAAGEKAQAEYFLADFDARHDLPQAKSELASFHAAHRLDRDAAKYALEAIWRLAKLHPAASAEARDAFAKTITAWKFLETVSPDDAKRSPWIDYAAEAEYVPLDQEIEHAFHPNYDAMTVVQVFGPLTPVGDLENTGAYLKDSKVASDFESRLRQIAQKYPSDTFAVAATARRGTLHDSFFTALSRCMGPQPAIAYAASFPPAVKPVVLRAWREAVFGAIDARATNAVVDYALAVAHTKNERLPVLVHARSRLAVFTIVLGNAAMRRSLTRFMTYRDDMFLALPPLPTNVNMSLDVMPALP